MNIDAWAQSFSSALSIFWTEIAGFLPNLIATIIVVVIGLYLSKLVTKWIAKIIQKVGFNELCEKLGIEKSLQTLGFKASSSELVGGILHIFFVLIILVAAADTLGLDRFSAVLDDFVLYLPKLFGAVLIALIGLFIAKKAKTQVESALDNVGVEYSTSVGRLLQMLILFVTFSLVVGQLDLETQLLNTIFTVLIASLGIALALALGLGTKGIANSIVSGIYAREQLLPGDEVTFDGFTGNVVMVSTVNTLLENKSGEQLSIPNQELLNTKYTVVRLADRK
jgi:small-conductance mechanosensitive channel